MTQQEFEASLHQLREDSVEWYRDWEYAGDEIWVPGREGTIRCRLYRPSRPVSTRLPVFFDLHGGGWAVHRCEADQPFCVKAAESLGILVVSIDYRLAPEHRFPAPVDDAFDVICHFYKNAEQYGIDPMRMGIGGHSAGGHLSVCTALRAAETNAFPLRCMILDYPGIDLTDISYKREIRMQYGKLTEYQKEFVELCEVFSRCNFATDEQKRDYHCNLALATAEQLAVLPPAVITACEDDLLRFQDMEFAGRLMEAGVETTFRLFKGVVHGFTADLYYTPEAEEGHRMMIDGMRKYLL